MTSSGAHTPSDPAGGRRLGDATTTDRLPSTLLVPLGAVEQHGPHLPVDTDIVIATAWCDTIAESDPDTIVAPALPFGSSGEHQSFPGTLSIGQDALVAVLVELARSAAGDFRRVVFVSGHAGNAEPANLAIERLRREGHDVDLLMPIIAGADAHAGRTETSLMLHLDPDRVRMDDAAAGATAPLSSLIHELRSGGVAAVSDNGVLGDPAGATAEEGRALLAQLASRWQPRRPD